MSVRWMLALVAIVMPLLALGGSPAAAEELHFKVTNDRDDVVRMDFRSTSREHVWPGAGNSWHFDDNKTYSINISCQAGEYICYGAWVSDDSSIYWGVGYQNAHRCNNCCYHCDGSSPQLRFGE